MASSKFTRETCTCSLLGRPKDLSIAKLPTHKDIILCSNYERKRLGKLSKNNKEPRFSDIAGIVAEKVINLYKKVSIPQVTYTRVIQLIRDIHNRYQKIKRNINRVNTSDTLPTKLRDYLSSIDKLFDIASCKCDFLRSCTCPKEQKIPFDIQNFLVDQRNERKLKIPCTDDPIDVVESISNSNHSSQSSSASQPLEIAENESPEFIVSEKNIKKKKRQII